MGVLVYGGVVGFGDVGIWGTRTGDMGILGSGDTGILGHVGAGIWG